MMKRNRSLALIGIFVLLVLTFAWPQVKVEAQNVFAALGANNAFTGNNSFSGSSTFTGAVTINSNSVAYSPTLTIGKGTLSLSTTAISGTTCGTASTATVTGASNSSPYYDNLLADFSTDYTGTVGFEPGNMLTIEKWITANTINFKLCNNTSSSITPGTAFVIIYHVVR
jgi:hypothetical protein